jgi:hypothetical protein
VVGDPRPDWEQLPTEEPDDDDDDDDEGDGPNITEFTAAPSDNSLQYRGHSGHSID